MTEQGELFGDAPSRKKKGAKKKSARKRKATPRTKTKAETRAQESPRPPAQEAATVAQQAPAVDPEPHILTVSELTARISDILEESFPLLWIQGEVSNVSKPSSGHVYFTLKDGDAQIRVVLFKYQARYVKFNITDGVEALVRGKLRVYSPRGEYQIQAELVEPAGRGALELALQQLKEQLQKEGLFADERKKELPYLPEGIGVVTSPSGAAIRDIVHVLSRRCPMVPVMIAPVRVQGEGAAQEIAAAIELFNSNALPDDAPPIDLIMVARGGGSLEDLWAFNEEIVVRAIFHSSLPVLSGVGHEIDFTIADLVADVRAPTPSAAAEIAVPDARELKEIVERAGDILNRYVIDLLTDHRRSVKELRRHLKDPRERIGELAQRLDDVSGRLQSGLAHRLDVARERLRGASRSLPSPQPLVTAARASFDHRMLLFDRGMRDGLDRRATRLAGASQRLASGNPLAILDKGYSVTYNDADGRIIRDAADAPPDTRIRVRLARGAIKGTVTESESS